MTAHDRHTTDTDHHAIIDGFDRRAPARPPRALSSRLRDEQAGAFNLASIVVLAVVVVALGVTSVLLGRTLGEANSINAKAENISRTGRGINTATDSVIQLNRTNDTASSILETATPLEGQLNEIITLAQEIDQLAASINGTAGTINSTANTIGNTAVGINDNATGINSEAAQILDVARRINSDVADINQLLADTVNIAQRINRDSNNIIREARDINRTAAAIDSSLP